MAELDRILGLSNESDPKSTKSQYLASVFSDVVGGLRATNIPPDDFKYYNSFPQFKERFSRVGDKLTDLMGKLSEKISSSTSVTDFQESEDISDTFQLVVDTVDTALEQVDLQLDNHMGLSKTTVPQGLASTLNSNLKLGKRKRSNAGAVSRASYSMMKPQKKFQDRIDNSNTLWVPIIREKPNAVTPLPDYERLATQSGGSPTSQDSPMLSASLAAHLQGMGAGLSSTIHAHNLDQVYPHPYAHEIKTLKFKKQFASACKEKLFAGLKRIPCTWVDTEVQLRDLAEHLDQVTEIAIDLEHHSYRTFQGFTCLMQISTRTQDFLVDTIALRHCLSILNSSFTNPSIVKVLHGADMDIQWLQRDFGLYIVNLFDTGQAARAMEFPSFGLAYLLKHYCDVHVDKKYQLADWRIRPLPAEMLLYARQDTHYLLYIYDRMKNEAISTSQARKISSPVEGLVADGSSTAPILADILERSKQISLITYEKPLYTPTSHLALCKKNNLMLSEPQLRALAALYKWRDSVARREDESAAFIMPNHILISISESLPSDAAQFAECCHPIPQYARAEQGKVLSLIQQARLAPKSPFSSFSSNQAIPSQLKLPSSDVSMTSSNSISFRSSEPSSPSTAAMDVDVKESPVLTSDKLYKTAGWIGGGSGHCQSSLDSQIPLFDTTALRTPSSSSNSGQSKSSRVLTSPLKSDFASSLLGLSNDRRDRSSQVRSENDKQIEQNICKALQIHASLKSPLSLFRNRMRLAPASPSSKAVSAQQGTESATPTLSTPYSSRSEPTIADTMRTPNTGTSADQFMTSPIVPGSALDIMQSPMEKDVPRSLREIYKLSNVNRRKNKDKRKSKQQTKKQGAEQTRITNTPSSPAASSDAFMGDIGWTDNADNLQSEYDGLEGKEPTAKRAKNSAHQKAKKKTSQRFKPFNYGKYAKEINTDDSNETDYFDPNAKALSGMGVDTSIVPQGRVTKRNPGMHKGVHVVQVAGAKSGSRRASGSRKWKR